MLLNQLLKWLLVTLMAAEMIFFGAITVFVLMVDNKPVGLGTKSLLIAFLAALMLASGAMAWRFACRPVALFRKGSTDRFRAKADDDLRRHSRWAVDPRRVLEIQGLLDSGDFGKADSLADLALERYPGDVLLLALKAQIAARQNRWADAERLYGKAASCSTSLGFAGYAQLLRGQIRCAFEGGAIERLESLCGDYINSSAPIEAKVHMLDALACMSLYREDVRFLDCAERWARKAIELAPESLTLRGTLGSVLVERGNDDEAEALPRHCLEHAPAAHDQGISVFYLGMLAARRNQAKEAKSLLRRAMILHPEAWLLQRANVFWRRFQEMAIKGIVPDRG